ncbi:MAG: FtsH protease activity modulator HflK [Candidatus Neomarinimicrobiota bacterium]|nr:MAG: FtsH protease activity modulator HflK [Candidatus Neomarinimicrobiota bacterium]
MATKRIIIGNTEIKVPLRLFTLGVLPIVVIALGLWLLTGMYTVGPDEVGVVRTFGKVSRVVGSGLRFHVPYPFEVVDTPKVTEVKRIEIGFRSIGNNQYRKIDEESQMLTGDENIVDAELIVQYKIKDPVAYLFNFVKPEMTVREAAEAALRTVIGRHKIDEALTSGKLEIQEETKELLQSILDKYQTGILVVAAQLQDVSPPKEVVDAFKDVASAKEDKNRMINQAEGYRNDVIPKARGEAQAMIREAEGFREARIKRAEGDVAKFKAIVRQYKQARDITKKRLYLEAMEEILPNIEKYILPDSKSGNLLNLLQLGQTPKGGQQ